MAEAYVRDATDQQDVDHQRYGVLVSAPTQGGDLVRCADVHRMVRSTYQWLAMIAGCMPRGVAVYGVLRPSAQAISRRMPSSTPTCASHPNSCVALVGR